MAELILDEHEQKNFDAWEIEHLNEKHDGRLPYAGAIGGLWVCEYVGTSIGPIVAVYCAICGKDASKKCLTDLNSL